MASHLSRSEQLPIIEKEYLTQSRLESFCKCPEAYRRRYIEGEIIPPGISLAKGTGVHAGAALNFTQKIESRVDLPASQIVEAAVAGFEEETRDGVSLMDDERSRGETIVLADAKDSVAKMAEVHAKQQAPEYQPVLVEQTVEIELPNAEVNLRGTLDLADDRRIVVDLKTSGRSKSQDEADQSVQLTVYAAAYHAATGEPSAEQRLETIVQTKTKTYRDMKSTTRTLADYRALAHRINAVHEAIRAGVFPPTTPGSWWCDPRYCGFFNRGCPYVNSERTARVDG